VLPTVPVDAVVALVVVVVTPTAAACWCCLGVGGTSVEPLERVLALPVADARIVGGTTTMFFDTQPLLTNTTDLPEGHSEHFTMLKDHKTQQRYSVEQVLGHKAYSVTTIQ
jgi:hypothetical protein